MYKFCVLVVAKTQPNINVISFEDRGCYHKIQGVDNLDSI